MRLLYEDDLVESFVFLCASGRGPAVSPLQVRRFHHERERCYAGQDPGTRNVAFARTHLGWFAEWGATTRFEQVLARFPMLAQELATLAFRTALNAGEEGAELYCNPEGHRQAVVALRPSRVVDAKTLEGFLHHELGHLADMVDIRFAYSPDITRPGQTAAQQRLVRERYRLLWDVSIDGRLRQRGLETEAGEAHRRAEFERGFGFLGEARCKDLFGSLWLGGSARHADLLALASDPRELEGGHAAAPGAPCPLCGFAAFEWAVPAGLGAEARKRIQAEFSSWDVEDSLCARCAEIYESISGLTYPSTICL